MKNYPQELGVYRIDFQTVEKYRQTIKECKAHYQYYEVLVGGYKFFEFEDDYESWLKEYNLP